MIADPRMSVSEAAEVRRRLISFWPQPELDEAGIVMLTQAVLDSGLACGAALRSIRSLMQEDHGFRPSMAALKCGATPRPLYFQPFAVLPGVLPADAETVRVALAAARGVLGADMEATRAAKAARDAQRGALTEGDRERWDRYVKVGDAAKRLEESLDSGT